MLISLGEPHASILRAESIAQRIPQLSLPWSLREHGHHPFAPLPLSPKLRLNLALIELLLGQPGMSKLLGEKCFLKRVGEEHVGDRGRSLQMERLSQFGQE